MPNKFEPTGFYDANLLTYEQKRLYRQHGVFPSESVCLFEDIMEDSDIKKLYQTRLGLFHEKINRTNIEDIEKMPAKTWKYADAAPPPPFTSTAQSYERFELPLELSKAIKPVLLEYLAHRTGFTIKRDSIVYKHPHYPYMLCGSEDYLYRVDADTGEVEAILVVTVNTSFRNQEKWLDGVPFAKEIRCRHSMSVMGIKEAWIICITDNNESGIFLYRIRKDELMENRIIQKVKNFWINHVEAEILPLPIYPSDTAQREYIKYFKDKKALLPQLFEKGLQERMDEYLHLHDIYTERKTAFDSIKQELGKSELQLAPYLANRPGGVCGSLTLKWGSKKSKSVDYEAFKLAYPAVYSRFVSEKTGENFSVKVKKNKGKEAA